MKIFLNSLDWKIKGYWPYEPILKKGVEVNNQLMGVTKWIEAQVPGSIHVDLLKAGLINDPYYEINSINCEWVEHRWWLYRAEFATQENYIGKEISIVFKGVDYSSHFYLNGLKLGEHKSMFEEIKFEISGHLKYDSLNMIEVLIESPPLGMGQIGYTSLANTLKSRFSYKWDFGTRLVNSGIWDDVFLNICEKTRINDTHVKTDYQSEKGFVKFNCLLSGNTEESGSINIEIKDPNGNVVAVQKENIRFDKPCIEYSASIIIEKPELWYPLGYGEQPIYEILVYFSKDSVVQDSWSQIIGIRSLSYKMTKDSPNDSYPYIVCINNVDIYLKGANITPLDMMYGTVSDEDYFNIILMLKNSNINIVRVWGGGLIEKDIFYNLCDRHGILIWQDFMQSGSGIENIPSKDESYIEKLSQTASCVVKNKRNHVSHTIWCGGNELTDYLEKPITEADRNISILKSIVERFDEGKLFLPSSPSGPNLFLDTSQIGKNYDVHGKWKYEGSPSHYTTCNCSDSQLHSEFGVDGCSHSNSLSKFLSKKNLKVCNMKDNMTWRHHGEWWDTYFRDKEIFGSIVELEKFTLASQLIQAEGIRYIVESNRRRQFQNAGSIIWQFNEPWPNVSCTSLVDYYRNPKMAYYYLRTAYQKIHPSLRYEKLSFNTHESFSADLFLSSELDTSQVFVTWEILDVYGKVHDYKKIECKIKAGETILVDKIKKHLEPMDFEIFFVKLKVFGNSNIYSDENLYIFSQKEKQMFSSMNSLICSDPNISIKSDAISVFNPGNIVCLMFHGLSKEHKSTYWLNNNFTALFPGETQKFKIFGLKAQEKVENLQFSFHWWNKTEE